MLYFLWYRYVWISTMHGVVIAFASWYVPTVLFSSDRLVKTTNPQNDRASGTIDWMRMALGLNRPAVAQTTSPSHVITKCSAVRVTLGKLWWVYSHLFSITMQMEEAKLTSKQPGNTSSHAVRGQSMLHQLDSVLKLLNSVESLTGGQKSRGYAGDCTSDQTNPTKHQLRKLLPWYK